jgi:hypothetical protein
LLSLTKRTRPEKQKTKARLPRVLPMAKKEIDTMWTYALGLILPLTAILWFSRRLPPSRRARARKFAAIWTAVLFTILGVSFACELNAGGVESGQNGAWYGAHSVQPGAYRVPGGTVIPGTAQAPGCGGGAGQYPCPVPVFVPDR